MYHKYNTIIMYYYYMSYVCALLMHGISMYIQFLTCKYTFIYLFIMFKFRYIIHLN